MESTGDILERKKMQIEAGIDCWFMYVVSGYQQDTTLGWKKGYFQEWFMDFSDGSPTATKPLIRGLVMDAENGICQLKNLCEIAFVNPNS